MDLIDHDEGRQCQRRDLSTEPIGILREAQELVLVGEVDVEGWPQRPAQGRLADLPGAEEQHARAALGDPLRDPPVLHVGQTRRK